MRMNEIIYNYPVQVLLLWDNNIQLLPTCSSNHNRNFHTNAEVHDDFVIWDPSKNQAALCYSSSGIFALVLQLKDTQQTSNDFKTKHQDNANPAW